MNQTSIEKTVIIYTSARKQGNTARQVEGLVEQSRSEVVYLEDYSILPYRYDNAYENDDFYELFDGLLKYDHWVLVSPVYWYSTTSHMKLFIDRITDYMDVESLKPKLRSLRTKRFSLFSNSIKETAPDAFIDMFRHTFTYLGMTFVSHEHVYMPD